MKTLLFFILLLLISLGITSCFSQEIIKAESDLKDRIKNESIRKIIEENTSFFPNNTQVSIAIINQENTQYIGIIRKDDVLQITDNKNNIFEIGSISKVFTAVLFSDFINKKEAFLEENLSEQFDFPIKEGGDITLQQLANHTSGLSKLPSNMTTIMMLNPENPYKKYTPKLLQEYLTEKIKLKNKIGEKSDYSNLGVGMLGYILTKKTDKTYNKLLQDRICNGLQMKSTTSNIDKIDKTKLIKGLDEKGKEVSNWDFTDVLVGAGGIKSSVVDLEKFVRKNFENNRIFNLPQQPTFSITQNRKIGLGWVISKKDNQQILWHNGGTGGYRSCLAINKEKKQSVIILSNVSAFHKNAANIDNLCIQLLK